MKRWLVVFDDPELVCAYRAEVDAETREEAIQRLAEAAVARTLERWPGVQTAAVRGAALPEFAKLWGAAVPIEGCDAPTVDLTEAIAA